MHFTYLLFLFDLMYFFSIGYLFILLFFGIFLVERVGKGKHKTMDLLHYNSMTNTMKQHE